MKIRNDDLGKLNEWKLDFLAPPYSFRLNAIAKGYINKTIEIMNKYVNESNNHIEKLRALESAIDSTSDMSKLKDICKHAAEIITDFTIV